MRLIDADALKEKVEAIIFGCSFKGDELHCELNSVLDYISNTLIDGAPTMNEWIPCSERLPSEKGNYLVWYRFYDVIKDKIMSSCKIAYYSTELDHWLGLRYSEYSRDVVLAWMPLPEPYKEESHEID